MDLEIMAQMLAMIILPIIIINIASNELMDLIPVYNYV